MLAKVCRIPLASLAAGMANIALNEKGLDDMMRAALPIADPSGSMKNRLSMKELYAGQGAPALPGMWATCHYRISLVGDGTVIEDTRGPGRGSRGYGEPYQFEVAAITDGMHSNASKSVKTRMQP